MRANLFPESEDELTPTRITIHCSDSDNPAHNDISVIDKWHKERGFKRVGYHFFINSFGETQRGRPVTMQGAHVKHENEDNIGICLHGKTAFTARQMLELKRLVYCLMVTFGIPENKVKPHHYYNKGKTCPNFKLPTNWERWIV